MKITYPVSILITLLLTVIIAEAKRQNTMQPSLRIDSQTTGTQSCDMQADTVTDTSGLLRLSGYDKPINANRETMLVTNLARQTVAALDLEITYYDIAGRMLHSAPQHVTCDIPAGETRLIEFPTWDRQHSFYYIKSVKPRRQATPYDIQCTVTCIVLLKDIAPDAAETYPQEVKADNEL